MLRKVLFSVSIVVALVAALSFGGVAYAQGPTPQTPTPNQSPFNQFWDNLARRLGTTVDTLKQAVRDAAKDTVDQAVAAGRLTQQQGDNLKQRIDQWQGNGLPFAGRGFGPGKPFGGDLGRAMLHMGKVGLDAAAQALGMQPNDLMAELRQGKTLRQIAQARNVDPATVERAIVDAEKAEIDKALAAGRITADQAARAKQRVEQMAQQLMDRSFPGPKPGDPRPGRPGQPGQPRQPAPTATPARPGA